MKKLYQVFFVDEYMNNFELGWFKNLDDCIKDINSQIDIYGNGKYILEPGDIKEYTSTFGMCFDTELSALFADKTPGVEEEVYDDFQSCAVRGFIHYFEDEEYENAVELFVGEEDKSGKETVGNIDYYTLQSLLQIGRGKTILNAIRKDEKKFVNDLLTSLIDISFKEINISTLNLIDYEKFGIDKNKVFSKEEIEELEEVYSKNEICITSTMVEKLEKYEAQKEQMKLLGYYVYNWQFVEYYEKEDSLVAMIYYCPNNEKKSLALVFVSQKENGVM